MKKVYIVNRGHHDFSAAERYGELVFLSEGPMPRYQINNIARQFSEVLQHSSPDDYILPCSLSSMNIVACALFAARHMRLNLLLYKNRRYVERSIVC